VKVSKKHTTPSEKLQATPLDIDEVAAEFKREAETTEAKGDIVRSRKLMAAFIALDVTLFLYMAMNTASIVHDVLEPPLCEEHQAELDHTH
jgi:hypothetical protein